MKILLFDQRLMIHTLHLQEIETTQLEDIISIQQHLLTQSIANILLLQPLSHDEMSLYGIRSYDHQLLYGNNPKKEIEIWDETASLYEKIKKHY